MELTIKTATTTATNSKGLKFKSIGCPINQPAITNTGATKKAICKLDPITTETDKSILFFMATVTAVACSAALPIIGNKITPVKRELKPRVSVATSKESTNNSEAIATPRVTTNKTATQSQSFGFFGECSDASGSSSCSAIPTS